VLEQAENDGLLVIDDIHLIDGRSDWQEALFHCFNRCSAQSVPIVAAGRAPPSALTTVLPDLQSRLSLLSVFRLPAWDLGDFEHLLSELLRARGVILSAEVARYLSIRLRRIPKEAVRVAKIIDQASLAEQRSPTIPFLKTLGL
jgi:DnaA family protein